MTSRRYSELSNAGNMSLIDEDDENSTPVAGDMNTPRAKLVPMKRTRISDSPLTSRQQNFAFKGDKNLEETFVEQSFIAAPPPAAESKSLIDDTQESETCNDEEKDVSVQQSSSSTPAQRTLSADSARKSVSFQIDKHLEETFVEQSMLASPPTDAKSLVDVSQKSEMFRDEEKLDSSILQSFSQTRIFDSPLTSSRQQNLTGDKNLEETFVEQSFLAAPSSAAPESKSLMDVSQKSEMSRDEEKPDSSVQQSFTQSRISDSPLTSSQQQNSAGDKSPDEASVEQSFLAATPAVKSESLLDVTQKNETSNDEEKLNASVQSFCQTRISNSPLTPSRQQNLTGDKNVEETSVKQSFLAASPPAAESKSLMNDTRESETFNDEEKLDASVQQSTSAQRTQSADISYLGASMVSFLEEEMQIYAEEQCKCARFQSVIKEYTALREKFNAKPRGESVNTTMKNEGSFSQQAEDEIFHLNEELIKTKMEVEDYKKAADVAKKEADDFQFVLDEEKRRAKYRLADLQKENFALSDELETLKLGRGDAVEQQNDATKELQEQILQLNAQYLKANTEVEQFKRQAESAQQEAENLRNFMKVQKDSVNSCVDEALRHKNAEIESLKAAIGDTVTMKKELVHLKEKAKMFDEVVKRGFEVEEICKELKAKMVSMKNAHADLQSQNDVMVNSLKSEIAVLENEKVESQKAYNDKDDELNQLKSSGEKEKAEMQEQIAILNDQLSKVTVEVEEFKSKADVAKKEADDFQFVLDEEKRRAENRIAELQKENCTLSDELQTLKLSNADAVEQQNDAITKLQEQIFQLNAQYLKANASVEEYKSKVKSAQQEAEDLQYALNAEKDSMNARIAETEQQKNAEIESLKAAIGDSEAMKKELVQLKEKEKMFDDAVKKGSEVEEICKELKAKMASLKDALEEKNTELQEKLAQLNDQLLKATDECEEYKTKAERTQKEVNNLQAIVTKGKEILNSRINQLKSENDVKVNSLKSEIDVLGNDKANLQKAFNDKDEELNQLKSSVEKNKAEMKEQISFLTDQLSKVTLEVEELKSKADLAKKEAEALSATNEKLNKKISKLYDDLDAADAERKESSELIFDLSTKLSKYTGEEVRGGINMAEVVSPRPVSPDNSFKSVNEEPQPSSSSFKLHNDDEEEKGVSPTKSKGTPKRKQSFGARIASPFRRGNKKEESQNTSAAAKKDDNATTSCATQ